MNTHTCATYLESKGIEGLTELFAVAPEQLNLFTKNLIRVSFKQTALVHLIGVQMFYFWHVAAIF